MQAPMRAISGPEHGINHSPADAAIQPTMPQGQDKSGAGPLLA